MELKQGYKQTEIGVMPEEWGITELGKIGVFSKGSGVRKDQSNSGEIACVRYGELYTKHNNYIKTICSFISKEVSLQAKRLKKGDILFAGSGETKAEIGKSAAFIDEIEAYAGGDIVILTPKEFDSMYLGYLLNASFIQSQKASRGQGDAVVHISSNNLSSIKIPQPTLQEQTAIANALSDMDALISQTEKLIEKKKAIKQGAMQELLKPKDGWTNKNLGDVCGIIGGGTPSTANPIFWNGEINWFTPTEVGLQKYLCTSNRKISKVGLVSCSARILPAGTILLTTRAGIGDLGILKFDAATNQGFQNLLPNPEVDNEFIYYLMQTKKSELIKNASGSTFLEISPRKLKAIEVSIPPLFEQKKIATILREFDEYIEVFNTKMIKLKLQKKGMMQALLTGSIRIS